MPDKQEDVSWIGRRAAQLRRDRGWTLAMLGNEVGLSSTQLSRIESGARQPSVGTLIELARAFGVTLSELVAENRVDQFHLVRAGERSSHDTANGVLAPLSGNYPGLAAVHLTIPVAAEAPRARHQGEEWLYVLAGSIEVSVDATTTRLEAGDAVHFPSHAAHSVRSVGSKPAETLIVSTGTR
ncbi:helix-turn-helix domain-containing protein [Nocardia vermiculata]|uniref:helix-turn-helix domain-containing protein n=1 Tax=Nocardia vermiculata TaxID=257274 RepID=UPI00082EED21|nr:XRE family transcriptional regulator [Nocardia vermiculata]